MEMTFYDDAIYRGGKGDGKGLKRPVTLDLDTPETMSKKQKFAAILTSPDLHMLKLASPELERFIISNGNITTTPTPTQFLFPKNVTEEQEQYARGFIDALNQLHQTHFEMSTGGLITRISTGTTPVSVAEAQMVTTTSGNATTVPKLYNGVTPFYLQPLSSTTSVIKSLGAAAKPEAMSVSYGKSSKQQTLVVRPPSVDTTSSNNSCNSMSSSSMTMSHPMDTSVKEELQLVPSDFSSPPLSPIGRIDMADQERIKLERKRYRNRVAASKCRKRKLEKISQLEDKVKDLKGENTQLESIVDKLRQQVCSLKQEVLNHVKKGCQIMITHAV